MMPMAEKASSIIRIVSVLPLTDAWPFCSSAFSRIADDMAVAGLELHLQSSRASRSPIRELRQLSSLTTQSSSSLQSPNYNVCNSIGPYKEAKPTRDTNEVRIRRDEAVRMVDARSRNAHATCIAITQYSPPT